MTVIERCPTKWRDEDGVNHSCLLDWPHSGEHECACGRCIEQLIPRKVES